MFLLTLRSSEHLIKKGPRVIFSTHHLVLTCGYRHLQCEEPNRQMRGWTTWFREGTVRPQAWSGCDSTPCGHSPFAPGPSSVFRCTWVWEIESTRFLNIWVWGLPFYSSNPQKPWLLVTLSLMSRGYLFRLWNITCKYKQIYANINFECKNPEKDLD